MRTTVTFDDDVLRLIVEFREQHGVGLSGAVNALIRRRPEEPVRKPFVQETSRGRARMDVTDVGGVLAILDEEGR